MRRRSSRRIATGLFAAIFVSALGLAWLGLTAYDAAETRARLRAREVLAAAVRSLSETARAVLEEAEDVADAAAADDAVPDSPLLAETFLATPEGRILTPAVQRFAAAPRPAEDEARAVERLLHEVDREIVAGGDPLLAALALEQSLADHVHPDLTAVIFARTADLYLDGGRPDRALYLHQQIVETLPGARDLDGAPLTPSSHLAILDLLRAAGEGETGDRDAAEAEAERFAGRLADRAWDLPVLERNLLLDRATSAVADPVRREAIARRAAFVDVLEAQVLPDAAARLVGPAGRRWHYEAREGGGPIRLVGWRARVDSGRVLAFGYLLDSAELRRRIDAEADRLHTEQDVDVTIRFPGNGSVASAAPSGLVAEGDLGGPLHVVGTRVSFAGIESYSGLKALHLGMTVLFTVGLLLGILLSLRAAGREVTVARIRKNLVDDVSHELRTPLTSIRMYAEMLDEEELPEEKRERYTAWIRSESERLSRLVDDVLDLSRLEREEGPGAAAPVDPAVLVAEAVDQVAPAAAEHGLAVAVELPDDLPAVRAVPGATARALANLLGNAVKYSQGPGEIDVGGRVADGFVRLTVRDRGPGIDEASREQLFTRFFRAPRDARKASGFGLGLVLAREIARAAGGDVVLESTGPDGSRFALSLPVVKRSAKTGGNG